MFVQELCTEDVRLIKPDIKRDVPLGLKWTAGEDGKQTLRLMGNSIGDGFKPNEQNEIQRYKDFLEITDQINWMIEYKGSVIGTVWVDLTNKNTVKCPSVHIMIGDKSARGKGVGYSSIKIVLDYLKQNGHEAVYSRTLIENEPMQKVFINLGFQNDGPEYSDENSLKWQNVVKRLK